MGVGNREKGRTERRGNEEDGEKRERRGKEEGRGPWRDVFFFEGDRKLLGSVLVTADLVARLWERGRVK